MFSTAYVAKGFPGRSLVNPSTPQHKCWGLLRVDPERRFLTPLSKAGFGAAEWVNYYFPFFFPWSAYQSPSDDSLKSPDR
jgi:hypothetical protein